MTARRGGLAIATLVGWVALAAGCLSLKADDEVAENEAGPIDASARDATHGSTRDANLNAGDNPRAKNPDATLADDADDADGADSPSDNVVDDGVLDGGNASDFYVGLAPPDGGTQYPTIHAALDAANASSAGTRTIHVGPGTYSNGESFPIVLRGGISLIGSGASTVLSGVGPAEISPPTGLPVTSIPSSISSTDVVATVVVGDATKASTIAHLTIQGQQPTLTGSEAIVCDRGATAAPGPTDANTIIDDVRIDGFPIDVNVTSSFPIPGRPRSGCAAQITASTLTNGRYAVVAAGWTSPEQLVSIQLGDGTGDGGNVFMNFHDLEGNVGNGAALEMLDQVTGVRVFGNRMSNSDMGISINQVVASDTSSGVDIEQNDIGLMDNAGINLAGPTIVERLVGNTIHDVATPVNGADFLGCGLVVATNGSPVLATVRLARNNSFFGNDVGVMIRSQEQSPVVSSDFGTASSNGYNAFLCNASPTARNGYSSNGGDVLVALPGAAGLMLPFVGNMWDHAPPHIDPNGDDVTIEGQVVVDTSNASMPDASACTGGRGPGP